MSDPIGNGIARMLAESTRLSPTDVLELLDLMCELLAARAARFHVADYSLRTLQLIDASGRLGSPQMIAGTLIGRVFTSGEMQVLGSDPTVVLVPLVDGSSRRASLENVPVRETVRHLADNIIDFSDDALRDDATMLLMEHRPPST